VAQVGSGRVLALAGLGGGLVGVFARARMPAPVEARGEVVPEVV
jgi:hypothetical protein